MNESQVVEYIDWYGTEPDMIRTISTKEIVAMAQKNIGPQAFLFFDEQAAVDEFIMENWGSIIYG